MRTKEEIEIAAAGFDKLVMKLKEKGLTDLDEEVCRASAVATILRWVLEDSEAVEVQKDDRP